MQLEVSPGASPGMQGHLICHGSYVNKPITDKLQRKLRVISNFQEQLLHTAAGSMH